MKNKQLNKINIIQEAKKFAQKEMEKYKIPEAPIFSEIAEKRAEN